MNRRRIGSAAEDAAAAALQQLGYRILDRNVHFSFGELDLVCEHRGVVVFVEVKARSGPAAGDPFEAVTPHKRRQVARLAEAYLQRQRLRARACRFDVVAVHLDRNGTPLAVEVLPDAFRL